MIVSIGSPPGPLLLRDYRKKKCVPSETRRARAVSLAALAGFAVLLDTVPLRARRSGARERVAGLGRA